jgi:phosphate/sulfate permease
MDKKDSDSIKSEALKDSYLLFFAIILGAIGAILINSYFAHPQDFGSLVEVIVYLLVASFIGGHLPYFLAYILPKWIKKWRNRT